MRTSWIVLVFGVIYLFSVISELKNRCMGRHCLEEVVTEQWIQKKYEVKVDVLPIEIVIILQKE